MVAYVQPYAVALKPVTFLFITDGNSALIFNTHSNKYVCNDNVGWGGKTVPH